MSTIANCPTCGSTSKIKEKDGKIIYEAVQNEEAFKKIGQLKIAMEKFKTKAETLEKELKKIKLKK
ncbi:hypothetical protein [Cochleicola gelatinilyticus]|uniref:Uncharacterized protein n=1 Tax=Cochleicola gelatinilyticus TaxID=1763537 RepID=A0A167IPM1_9FLAO|nr:hypothetical protein [Cochleicola gelatinilyticus]OAB79884.1 hypothetical protein ULVI_03855 [Cochleicola gelatinilyticus]